MSLGDSPGRIYCHSVIQPLIYEDLAQVVVGRWWLDKIREIKEFQDISAISIIPTL